METPEDLRYTVEHEWAKLEDENKVVVGITDYAQESLGDIVYLELPKEGTEVAKDSNFGVIESVKTVSDLYAPVSGTVVEINDSLIQSPETINDDPYGDAWMIKIELANKDEFNELMTAKEYATYVTEEK